MMRQVSVPLHIYNQIAYIARESRITMSEAIIRALLEYINSHKLPEQFTLDI